MSALLELRDLHKHFGGIAATNGLNLAVAEGETHALIGPNGAGKTTVISQIAGDLRPSAGTIVFAGEEITRLSAVARVQRGLARSFQITSVFPDFTALENVALAGQIKRGASFRFWRRVADDRTSMEYAAARLAQMGMGDRATIKAADLSHGERKQLELAMTIETGARMLLLDEPMAGMGHAESRTLTAILSRLKKEHTILLVEHDMDAVFELADRVTVIVYGKAIFTGTPGEVRDHPGVRKAYLGEGQEVI